MRSKKTGRLLPRVHDTRKVAAVTILSVLLIATIGGIGGWQAYERGYLEGIVGKPEPPVPDEQKVRTIVDGELGKLADKGSDEYKAMVEALTKGTENGDASGGTQPTDGNDGNGNSSSNAAQQTAADLSAMGVDANAYADAVLGGYSYTVGKVRFGTSSGDEMQPDEDGVVPDGTLAIVTATVSTKELQPLLEDYSNRLHEELANNAMDYAQQDGDDGFYKKAGEILMQTANDASPVSHEFTLMLSKSGGKWSIDGQGFDLQMTQALLGTGAGENADDDDASVDSNDGGSGDDVSTSTNADSGETPEAGTDTDTNTR